VLGLLKTTKTGRTRTVRLLAPLAADLREWRIACGRPADDALVFPGHRDSVWSDDAWRYWRRRVFGPATRAAGIAAPVRPYDLRHSFVSLLIAEGSERRRDRAASRPLADDHAVDLRPPLRRTAARPALGRGRDPSRAAGATPPATYPIRTRRPTRALPRSGEKPCKS
jgi:integrase